MSNNDEGDDGRGEEDAGRKRTKPYAETYRGNNEGGYGNPPVKSQFKKGGKGGPGRKKGDQSLEGAMRKMFGSRVSLANADGKSVPMPEAIALRAKKEILSGPIKGLEIGLKLLEKYGPQKEEQIRMDLSSFNHDEIWIFNALLNRGLGDDPLRPEPSIFGREYDYTMVGDYCVRYRSDGHIELIRLDGSGSDFII